MLGLSIVIGFGAPGSKLGPICSNQSQIGIINKHWQAAAKERLAPINLHSFGNRSREQQRKAIERQTFLSLLVSIDFD